MSSLQQELARLGLTLPAPVPVHGRFRPVVVRGDLAIASAAYATTGPPFRLTWPGRVGAELTVDDGKASAEGALLGLLANLQAELGDLDRVEGILQVCGYVNVAAGFDKVHHVV